jgi:hydrogenase expression/formation protein HypC
MCLAVPMEVLDIDGQTAWCSVGGVRRAVSLFIMPPGSVAPGDVVIVHVGYAIQKLVRHEASTTWELIDQMHATQQPDQHA